MLSIVRLPGLSSFRSFLVVPLKFLIGHDSTYEALLGPHFVFTPGAIPDSGGFADALHDIQSGSIDDVYTFSG